MRLRPRQVLCSKCRSICNENSENVQIPNSVKDNSNSGNATVTNHLKQQQQSQQPRKPAQPLAAQQQQQPMAPSSQTTPTKDENRMVLRKRRKSLENSSIGENLEGKRTKPCDNPANCPPSQTNVPHSQTTMALPQANMAPPQTNVVPQQSQVSSQQSSVVPSQTSVTQQSGGVTHHHLSDTKVLVAKTSPVIKISFGPQGQGTVLKINPRSHQGDMSPLGDSGGDISNSASPLAHCVSPRQDDASAKAAKKALKKAKKEAHRRSITPVEPFHHHKSRHHKHKFKHKRRRREEEENENNNNMQQDGTNLVGNNNNLDLNETNWNLDDSKDPDAYSKIKKECLRQKLSISLKRLNAKAYMRCSPPYAGNPHHRHHHHHHHEDSNSSSSSSLSSSSLGHSDTSDQDLVVPEFPETDHPNRSSTTTTTATNVVDPKPLIMRVSSHNVRSCTIGSGRSMAVGDIVWGKIHGFPWWPGRVLSITVSQKDNGLLITQQAHVAWFGSSTSSYMSCNQLVPFLECFKTRYNKKKRGPYKEAIKQATLAAQRVHGDLRHVSASPVHHRPLPPTSTNAIGDGCGGDGDDIMLTAAIPPLTNDQVTSAPFDRHEEQGIVAATT